MDEGSYQRSVHLGVPAAVVGAVGLAGFVYVASEGFGRRDDGVVRFLVVFAGLAGVSAMHLTWRLGPAADGPRTTGLLSRGRGDRAEDARR